jgi:hypothetical protein
MHRFMVMMEVVMMGAAMLNLVMPMLCPVVRMAGERPARVVPEPLAVAQIVAPALRLARRTCGAVMGVPSLAMGVLRAATDM